MRLAADGGTKADQDELDEAVFELYDLTPDDLALP